MQANTEAQLGGEGDGGHNVMSIADQVSGSDLMVRPASPLVVLVPTHLLNRLLVGMEECCGAHGICPRSGEEYTWIIILCGPQCGCGVNPGQTGRAVGGTEPMSSHLAVAPERRHAHRRS